MTLKHLVKGRTGLAWCNKYIAMPFTEEWFNHNLLEDTTCHICLEFVMAFGERAATRYAELEVVLANSAG